MNEYDSNRILDITKKINYFPTTKKAEADCYIINTCHIREKATEKVFHDVGRVKKEFLPIKEDCNYHPASPYAISKVGTDLLAKFYFEAYNLKILTTRMFTHTGPRRGDVFAESSFAKQIAV